MGKLKYSTGIFAILLFGLHIGFGILNWPSIFNFLLLGIISSIILIVTVIFGRLKNPIARIALIFLAIVLIIIGIGFFRISKLLKESEPYLLTINEIRANSKVDSSFIESKYVTGSINEYEAELFFSILSNGKSIKVHSKFERNKYGDWKAVKLDFH